MWYSEKLSTIAMVQIDLKKNVMNVDFHVAQYAKIVEDLR